MLAGISRTSLVRWLPISFHPTWILNQPDLSRKDVALFCNSNHRGVVVPGAGGMVHDIACSKAIFTGTNGSLQEWGDQTIRINLPPSHPDLQQLDDRELEKITNEFQSLLLMYRLRNVHRVRDVVVGAPAFAGLELARNVSACVPDEPEVAQAVVPLLQSQQQDFLVQRSHDLSSVIVEVLWVLVHEGRTKVSPSHLADLANALLRSRGEKREYSAEEVGWRFHDLQIPRHKERSAMVLQFSRELSRRVHQLSRDRGLGLALHPETCSDCTDPQIVDR